MSTPLDSYSQTPIITIAEVDLDMPNMPEHLVDEIIATYTGGQTIGDGINEIFNTTSVTDATAPKSPSEVCRHTIPAVTEEEEAAWLADPEGAPNLQRSAGKVAVAVPGGGLNEVYMARWLKPSANLIGDPAGSKSSMWHYGGGEVADEGTIYWNYETTEDGVLIRPLISAPKTYTTAETEMRNDEWQIRDSAETPIPYGVWGLWEFYAKLNTAGVANGIFRVWANGVLQLERTNWLFLPTGSAAKFVEIKTDFYQNRARTFAMHWDMDHKVVAGV